MWCRKCGAFPSGMRWCHGCESRLPEPAELDQSDNEVQEAVKALNDGKPPDEVFRRLVAQGWTDQGVRRMFATLSQMADEQRPQVASEPESGQRPWWRFWG